MYIVVNIVAFSKHLRSVILMQLYSSFMLINFTLNLRLIKNHLWKSLRTV